MHTRIHLCHVALDTHIKTSGISNQGLKFTRKNQLISLFRSGIRLHWSLNVCDSLKTGMCHVSDFVYALHVFASQN